MIPSASKKASNVGQFKDGTDGPKVEGLTTTEDLHLDRSIGVKKPKHSQDEGPSMTELSGYNAKRQEFDPEYDNEAELSLAEMEFKETDSESDRELKLRVLRIYLSRLDERKRRKNFILERNLLYPSPLEKELSIEDREFYQQFKVFMRFLSQEEYESLLKTVLVERKIRKRIQELQECRAAGCHTLSEAKMYCEQKRKRELEANAQRLKESGQNVASDKAMKRPVNKERGESDGNSLSIIDNHKIESLSLKKSFDDWDIFGLPGAELLSESEQQLCSQCRILPSLYLKMQEVLFQEIFKGSVVKKSDAHPLFKVDPTKVDKVFDIVTKKIS